MNIKAKYMLEADLGVLHFETMEWIVQSQFYCDELSILQELVGRKNNQNRIEFQVRQDIDLRINTMMERVSNSIIVELEQHEKYLTDLLMDDKSKAPMLVERYLGKLFSAGKKTDENKYREKHRLISEKVLALEKDFRHLKQEIYNFLSKKHPKQRHGFAE